MNLSKNMNLYFELINDPLKKKVRYQQALREEAFHLGDYTVKDGRAWSRCSRIHSPVRIGGREALFKHEASTLGWYLQRLPIVLLFVSSWVAQEAWGDW